MPQKTPKDTLENAVESPSPKTDNPSKTELEELTALGEEMACRYLSNGDIEIVERNWKCESGEVNIIALEDDTLVFIEVKTRGKGFPGLPEYAITAEKRNQFEHIAVSYLSQNMRPSGSVRFDVIAVQMTGSHQCFLRHHRDFMASGTE